MGNAYTDLLGTIREKVDNANRSKGSASASVSRGDLDAITTTLLNTPNHTVSKLSFSAKDTSGTGEAVGVECNPTQRYRNALKGMARSLGLDKNDCEKLNDLVIGKEHASALIDVATTAIHDYMAAGRKFSFPLYNPDETRMEIYMTEAPERTSMGNRFKRDDPPSNTVTVTAKRKVLKGKNSVPYWLKSTKEQE